MKKSWLNYRLVSCVSVFNCALILWLLSMNETIKAFWDKPILMAFIFFFLVTIAYAIGAYADNAAQAQEFIRP